MVKIREIDRQLFPAFVAWLATALKEVPRSPLWPGFSAAADARPMMLRDALGGGMMSPTLEIASLPGGAGGAFQSSLPDVVRLDRRLATEGATGAETEEIRILARIALLAQIVAWRRYRDGKTDYSEVAQKFAADALGQSLSAAIIGRFGDNRVTIKVTAQDRDDLTRLTIAEAGGKGTRQGRDGQAGVIFVVMNRVASTRFPNSIRGVINEAGQFEPVGKTVRKTVTDLPMPQPADKAVIEAIIDDIIADRITDPTFGATFFQNVDITRQRRKEFAQGVPPLAVIVDHSFFDRWQANDPVSVPAWRLVSA